MSTSKFATWNVRGFRHKSKQLDFLAFAHARDIDALFVQETNFRAPLDVTAFRRDFHVDAFFSLTPSRACGVGVIFISGRFRQKAHCTFEANGRMLMLHTYINGKRVPFVNLYAPVTRSDTNTFFKELHQLLLELLPHVLLGDFNCVVSSQRHRQKRAPPPSILTSSVRIDEEESSALCREATVEELGGAIWCMPPNSAPGPDGLTAGFHATFLDTLGEALLAPVNVFFREQTKPISFGAGRIVLRLMDGAPPADGVVIVASNHPAER
ncbi:hypothetical protein HPB52_022900 [Rhipicephalus sanguineus]|uniref:Endonuclease/exonuclease/phosphatase domain-containing protein n=1 Tax=Rhipicephalus sanguineus TaxID=34632 RepID=A0A9D4Q4A3_RHISA|nr:hypothetical protein HPB52_022900 [Rhipicephalus sanguineus]